MTDFEFLFQVCDPQLNTLAHSLPSAHCSQSRLVCTMSGTALNENNQPMMLPNGERKKEKVILVDICIMNYSHCSHCSYEVNVTDARKRTEPFRVKVHPSQVSM